MHCRLPLLSYLNKFVVIVVFWIESDLNITFRGSVYTKLFFSEFLQNVVHFFFFFFDFKLTFINAMAITSGYNYN